MQYFGYFAPAVLLMTSILPLTGVQAQEAATCTAWQFDNDGGFEGGEQVAYTECTTPNSPNVAGLTVGCNLHLRFYSDDPTPPDAVATVNILYDFGAKAFRFPVILEEADNAWVRDYEAPELDPALLTALKENAAVAVSLEGGTQATVIGLTQSRKAIETMEAACQP